MNNKYEIIKYFKYYGINLSADNIINCDGILIPNYAIKHLNFCNSYNMFEFCHQFYKIYAPYINNGYTCYETKNTHITPQDIVFDCGGNMGLFAAYAASKAKSVYSFEPMSLIRQYLINTQQYYNNFYIIPYGLGRENSVVKFYQCDNPAASRNIVENNSFSPMNKILYTEYCNITTLDDFINTKQIIPTFIKADIEDGEIDMIQGGLSFIQAYQPKLSITLHSHIKEKIQYIQNLFSNYKFEIYADGPHTILIGGTTG